MWGGLLTAPPNRYGRRTRGRADRPPATAHNWMTIAARLLWASISYGSRFAEAGRGGGVSVLSRIVGRIVTQDSLRLDRFATRALRILGRLLEIGRAHV